MKKTYFSSIFILLLALLFTNKTNAQTVPDPVTSITYSTAAAPVWYNMNCAGTSNAVKNSAMAEYTHATLGEISKGDMPVAPAIVYPTQNQDKYLWRFEQDPATGIRIINKLTGYNVTYPKKPTSTERYRLTSNTHLDSTLFTPTAVSGISSNNVTGTAFYFMPKVNGYALIGRLNCDGTTAEWLLWRPASSGTGDISTGGKGSLYWLREVPMKNIVVTYGGTGSGTAQIMKDDGTTHETGLTVSKAKSISVTMTATASTGSEFVAWRDAATNTNLSTAATYTYSAATDQNIIAVFDLATSLNKLSNEVKISGGNGTLNIVNFTNETGNITVYTLEGHRILSQSLLGGAASIRLKVGVYLIKAALSNKEKTEKIVIR